MSKLKIAMLVGSVRTGSLNEKLARAVESLAPDTLQFDRVRIDDLPHYNGDFESARPAGVTRFTDQISEAQGAFFVTPEYNRSIPGMLKNAIDWGSKPMDRNVWAGKTAGMIGTTPGAIGTAVGQQHLRQILSVLGVMVVPAEAYVSFSKPDLISDTGEVSNDATRAFIQAYVDRFAKLALRLAD
tara:strand:+ start:2209 stop:2763 length:555 start_codon:yes stop_codon:yes gene_type:complete